MSYKIWIYRQIKGFCFRINAEHNKQMVCYMGLFPEGQF